MEKEYELLKAIIELKDKAVKAQQYSIASTARDMEKQVLKEIHKKETQLVLTLALRNDD